MLRPRGYVSVVLVGGGCSRLWVASALFIPPPRPHAAAHSLEAKRRRSRHGADRVGVVGVGGSKSMPRPPDLPFIMLI